MAKQTKPDRVFAFKQERALRNGYQNIMIGQMEFGCVCIKKMAALKP